MMGIGHDSVKLYYVLFSDLHCDIVRMVHNKPLVHSKNGLVVISEGYVLNRNMYVNNYIFQESDHSPKVSQASH